MHKPHTFTSTCKMLNITTQRVKAAPRQSGARARRERPLPPPLMHLAALALDSGVPPCLGEGV